MSREQFEAWWEKDGQFLRAGGGDYEKTFAFHAWQAATAAAYEDAARVCDGERLQRPWESDADVDYDAAVDNCVEAIRERAKETT